MSLVNILSAFKNKKVLVIGEGMLDCYITGDATRLCREGPVPIINTKQIEYLPGGAANTAANLAMLGADVSFASVIGNDLEGKKLQHILRNEFDVNTSGVFLDKQRKTITKKRIYSFSQLLLRLDSGSTDPVEDLEKKLISFLFDTYREFDCIVISDYEYGILTEKIVDALMQLQKHFPKVCVIDAKRIAKYISFPATLIKANYEEALLFLRNSEKLSSFLRIDQLLTEKEYFTGKILAPNIAITLDKDGSLILEEGGKWYRTYTTPTENSTTVGAGDTYVSGFALSLASGADTHTAAEIASTAASIVIGKKQTAWCTPEEIKRNISSFGKYVQEVNVIVDYINKLRQNGAKIVFTNGCFDILHAGHTTYLNRAKQLGDVLIVAVNSDDSVHRLKGKDRPINPLMDRIGVLSSLSCIDFLLSFSDDTPISLIKEIKPDIYVKGGDYSKNTLKETTIVEQLGGRVEIIPLVKNKSTTKIVNKIASNPHKGKNIL